VLTPEDPEFFDEDPPSLLDDEIEHGDLGCPCLVCTAPFDDDDEPNDDFEDWADMDDYDPYDEWRDGIAAD
jgi:hypothetical protein